MVKYSIVEHDLQVLDLCLFRTSALFIFATIYAIMKKQSLNFPKEHHFAMGVRAVLGLIAFTNFVFALKFLPIGIHMVLFNTNPFFATLFGLFITREATSKGHVIAMCIVFFGVLLIAFAKPLDSPDNIYTDPGTKVIGSCASLTVAVCFALISVLTRKMQDIHFSVVLFYYALFASVSMFLILIGIGQWNHTEVRLFHYTWVQYRFLIGMSCFNTIGMFCSTIALQLDSSSFVTTINQ